jgi:hypothetical protein
LPSDIRFVWVFLNVTSFVSIAARLNGMGSYILCWLCLSAQIFSCIEARQIRAIRIFMKKGSTPNAAAAAAGDMN